MDLSSGLAAVTRLVATVGALIAVASGGAAMAILWCHVAAATLGAVVSLTLFLRMVGTPIIDLRQMVHSHIARTYVTEAFPFAATGFVAMLYRRLDLLLLGAWHGELVAGWYGAAIRLWEAGHLLPASLLDALFPEMSRMMAFPNGRRRLYQVVTVGGAVSVTVGICLAAAGALLGPVGLRFIYGADVAGAVLKSWWFLVGALPAVFLYLLGGHALNAVGEQRAVTIGMLITALVNTVANVAVIPAWGHTGAAAVLMVSEWLLCLLLYGGARRKVRAEG
jgi:O-antigen/teichoic acid export membrane protein